MITQEFIRFRDDSRNKMYFSVFENNLYYSQREHNIDKYFVENGNQYELFSKSCVAHNFFPFWFGWKMYGIGGMDDWKADEKWRGLTYHEFKDMFEEHFKKPYKRGEKFYKEIKYKFDTTRIKKNCRGLYLFESQNCINWKQIKDKPTITAYDNGYNSSLAWKSAEFDGKISVCRLGDEYFIYIRNNIAVDRRFIQYTKTKDFITFSEFKNIDIEYNIKTDNYYFCDTFLYKNTMFGFFPFYNDDMCCIRFAKSKDGIKWDIITDLFKSHPFIIENGKRKNRDHPCGGVTIKKNKLLFHVHHNVLGYDNNMDSNVVCYSLNRGVLNELC